MKQKVICLIFPMLFILSCSKSIPAQNRAIIQFHGPDRDGVFPETNLLKAWPEKGPELLWSKENIGLGYSSAIVTEDRIYIAGGIDTVGYLFALSKTGKEIWKKPFGECWHINFPGVRSTPTLVDDYLYYSNSFGVVFCWKAENGEEIWRVDTREKYDAAVLRWGNCENLLIEGNRVFCTPGGSKATVVALNRFTGAQEWAMPPTGEESAFCSPIIVNHENMQMLITMTQKSMIGVNAITGEHLWSYPHETEWDMNCNTPYYEDGYVFTTSGFKTGSVKLKISDDGKNVFKIWENDQLDSEYHGFIVHEGYIYGPGLDGKGFVCVNWETGKTVYEFRDLKYGNIVYADGLFYIYTRNGRMALVDASPEQFKIISLFKIPKGTREHITHPTIEDGKLYVRHGNALMAYSIAQK